MTTTLKTRTCHKCGRRYQAWRCPYCYKGHAQHSGGGSTISKRVGAASVLGHQSWTEFDAAIGRVVDILLEDDPVFAARCAQEDANRAAIADEEAFSRG